MNNAIAIGSSASYVGGGVDSVAIGAGANGNSVLNNYSVAIGSGAGSAGQGSNCIAIGQYAGQTNQHNNTIILNATATALNSTGTDRCHISPIRSGGTGNTLFYDSGTKEIQVGGNASMAGLTVSGNIGIGTSNPMYNLHIVQGGTSGVTSTGKKGILITNNDASRILLENTTNTTGRRIASIGNDTGSFSIGLLNDTGLDWSKKLLISCNLTSYDTTFAGSILPETTSSTNQIGRAHV